VVDVAAVPHWLKNSVSQSKHEQILHRFLAQIGIDAIDLAFREGAREIGVFLPSTFEVAPNGFFDNDACEHPAIGGIADHARGLQVADRHRHDLRRHALHVEHRFMERISRLVWSLRPELPLFFNARLRLNGDPAMGNRPERGYYSHWEIESLASGGWGYGHFPLYNRYFQTLGKPRLGMTAATCGSGPGIWT